MLAVRDGLQEATKSASQERDIIQSKPNKNRTNQHLLSRSNKMSSNDDDVINNHAEQSAITSVKSSEQRQQQLMAKCLKLLKQKHFLEMAAETGSSRVGAHIR